jgi:NAD(P)-dependent dehydrogenase (short-subunit alcohol dehydrogenase family)
MDGLSGKSVIVTGGASGIGRATATLLAESGCAMTVADMNDTGGNETVAQIRKAGGKAQYLHTDVTNEADVRAMVNLALATYGRLDGAVNAAGVANSGKQFHELTLDDLDRCLNINLRGVFLCMREEVIAMQKSGGGSIVNIASMAAVLGLERASDYCASKAGVMGLVRGAAAEYVTSGIRVNAVLPGGTKTPMLQGLLDSSPSFEAIIAAVHPMNRLAQPREIATAVRFLISDDSSNITGHGIPVSGGQGVLIGVPAAKSASH